MMQSTLVTDNGGDATAASSTANPLFGGDDNDLFGSIDEPSASAPMGDTTAVNGGGGSKANLMGQLLGESAENVPLRAHDVISPSSSKLSTSGLLESSSSGGLFGDDNAGAGGGGSSGLFDDVDSEQAEKEKIRREAEQAAAAQMQATEERQRREAAMANQLGQQQQQHNISMDSNVDIMHELNLNDNNGEFMGMGMGLGGEIPKGPPAGPPPVPAQQGYQFSSYQPPASQQQQQQQQQQHQQQPQGVMNAMAGSYYYSTTGAGQMTGGQPNQLNAAAPNSARKQQPQPSVLAGMHVGHDVNLGGVAPSPVKYSGVANNNFPPAPAAITNYSAPPPFDPLYGKIVVSEPMLIQGSGLFAGPPHWTYLVTVHHKNAPSNGQPQPPMSAVRRRFRHFVALEDRLRQSVLGAILPPRPDKHPARAIEEATARQSADFAQQRSRELGAYMTALANHPYAGGSPELKLFLTLQDHIGTAWPEVSSSAFTRMTAVGSATVEKLTESVDGMLSELGTAQQVAAGEDSAEILALAAYEGRRIGAVSSSVPKVEGCVGLIRERGDRLGATGLEMSKLSKDVNWCDRALAQPMEILSGALLRSGRRTKRLGLELSAAIAPFVTQYRMCRYEQMAFADRRTSLKKRTEARTKADDRASKLMMHQSMGRLASLERMETEAAMYDEFATEAGRESEDVAIRLQMEVGRIRATRVKEWDASMKVVAGSMKEACAENAAIWTAALETFRTAFPDCPEISTGTGGGGAFRAVPSYLDDQVPTWHASYKRVATEVKEGTGWDRVSLWGKEEDETLAIQNKGQHHVEIDGIGVLHGRCYFHER